MINLPDSVSSQVYIFICSIAGGMLIAFIYDLFRIKRKAVKTRSIFIHIEDFAYWIVVALVMFTCVYLSNDGQVRGYIFIGSTIGVVLYVLLFSRAVTKVIIFTARVVKRFFKTLFESGWY